MTARQKVTFLIALGLVAVGMSAFTLWSIVTAFSVSR